MTEAQVTAIIAAVDFTTIGVGIAGIVAAIAGVLIIKKGGGMLLSMLGGK